MSQEELNRILAADRKKWRLIEEKLDVFVNIIRDGRELTTEERAECSALLEDVRAVVRTEETPKRRKP